ncbi:hypothetical protein [Spiroplasma taiwanense]|uniref:Uncharacterized protein n=1 Tax=Spiroplasma taiwanense CT-1 TaxID=1276220 RepID=S5MBK8_9MOLU|nr:hypothetical protein [Spiroplasma taiwanense]AGR41158.1 hypothetical protein STAIW_v1c05310 [Spiroplasma taiwanense CT-1]
MEKNINFLSNSTEFSIIKNSSGIFFDSISIDYSNVEMNYTSKQLQNDLKNQNKNADAFNGNIILNIKVNYKYLDALKVKQIGSFEKKYNFVISSQEALIDASKNFQNNIELNFLESVLDSAFLDSSFFGFSAPELLPWMHNLSSDQVSANLNTKENFKEKLINFVNSTYFNELGSNIPLEFSNKNSIFNSFSTIETF